jgi:hypothetical protein
VSGAIPPGIIGNSFAEEVHSQAFEGG